MLYNVGISKKQRKGKKKQKKKKKHADPTIKESWSIFPVYFKNYTNLEQYPSPSTLVVTALVRIQYPTPEK